MKKVAVIGTLVILIGGVACSAKVSAEESAASQTEDKMVRVGERSLHILCSGTGAPTVILEAGFGESLATWKSVQPEVARFTRVCSYDRAGRGRSDPDPRTTYRTSKSVVEDLSLLLSEGGVRGPYVLVGHSFGGAYMRLFASQFKKNTVGMVLVDATHEDQFDRFAAAGFSRSMPTGQNPERVDIVASLNEVREAQWRADIPLVVLRHGRRVPESFPGVSEEGIDSLEAVWAELQQELASRSPLGRLVIAPHSGHYVQNDEPQLVIDAIREVVFLSRRIPPSK